MLVLFHAPLTADMEAGPFVDLSLSANPLSGQDLSYPGRQFPADVAWRGLATLGWQVENGISVGATLGLGPWRRATSQDAVEDFTLQQGWLAASLGFDLPLGYSGMLGLRLSGGPAWLEGHNQSRAAGEIVSQSLRSAASTAWLAEARVERLWGQWGLGLSLGWIFSRFTEIRGVGPTGQESNLYQADGKALEIDHSGPLLRAFFRLYLNPPL